MERGFIVLVASLMVFVAPCVQGTFHLSFVNTTVNITRDGCGATKLCEETPADCDPAGNSSCLFLSVMAGPPMPPNGTYLDIELSGQTPGYIALGLTMSASEGTAMLFVCARINGSFAFRTFTRNNTDNSLSASERITRNIRGELSGDIVRCEFRIPNVNATSSTRASADTTFTALVGTGSSDGGNIGPFSANITTAPLNLADPTSNAATTAAPDATTVATTMAATMAGNMTTMAMTTASSGAVHPHAVLLLLSVLTLFLMMKA